MEHIVASLKKRNMSDSSIEESLLYATPRHYAKREILTSTAANDPNFYFIEQGVTRSYSIIDGHEVTSWFSMEGDITFSSRSFYGVREGYETETVQVLEPSLIYALPIAWLEELYTRNLEVANWSRCLHQEAHIGSVHRLIDKKTGAAAFSRIEFAAAPAFYFYFRYYSNTRSRILRAVAPSTSPSSPK